MFGKKKKVNNSFNYTPEEQKLIDKAREIQVDPVVSYIDSSNLLELYRAVEKKKKSQYMINKKMEEIRLRKIVREEVQKLFDGILE